MQDYSQWDGHDGPKPSEKLPQDSLDDMREFEAEQAEDSVGHAHRHKVPSGGEHSATALGEHLQRTHNPLFKGIGKSSSESEG